MLETEFEGQQVAFAIENTATAHDIAAALVGCSYYLDDPDVVWDITGAEWPGPIFALQGAAGQKRLTVPQLARGYIIETRHQSRLAPLIAQATPPHIAAAEDARGWLAKAGIHHPSLSNDDAVQLADALAASDGRTTPPLKTRALIASLMRRYGLDRIYVGIALHWLEESRARGERQLLDVVIQLVSAYREIRDYAAALQCTDVVLAPGAERQIPPTERAILFTQRAAIQIDFYDQGGDPARLASARKCAATSWAIGPSDQCGAVYARLKKAENELQDERASAARVTQQQRLDDSRHPATPDNFKPRGS